MGATIKKLFLGWVIPKRPQITPKLPFFDPRNSPFVFPNITKTLGCIGGFTDLGNFPQKTHIFFGGSP